MRKVDRQVESLGLEIDKSKVLRLCKSIDETVEQFRNRSLRFQEYPYHYLDGTFPKVREGGQVQSMGLVIAIGGTVTVAGGVPPEIGPKTELVKSRIP
jgi:putative transposase